MCTLKMPEGIISGRSPAPSARPPGWAVFWLATRRCSGRQGALRPDQGHRSLGPSGLPDQIWISRAFAIKRGTLSPFILCLLSNVWKFKQNVILYRRLLTLYIIVQVLLLILFLFLFLVLILLHVLVLVLFPEVCSSGPGSDSDPGLQKIFR